MAKKKKVEPSREAWEAEVLEWEPESTKWKTIESGPIGAHVFIRRPGPHIRGYGLWCIVPSKNTYTVDILLKMAKSLAKAKEWCAVCGWVCDGVIG